jgi:hypothetical protein
MAPHGFLGAGAGAGAAGAAAGAGLAAELVAFCAGAAGALLVLRCVTLLDCLPTEPPPPSRLAASAFRPEKAKAHIKTTDHNFIMTPINIDFCYRLATEYRGKDRENQE